MEFSKENIRPGMEVKLKNRRGSIWNIEGKMDHLKGAVVKVEHIDESGFSSGNFEFLYEDIENIVFDRLKKDYLQNGDILTDREGDISIFHNDGLIGDTVLLDDLNDDLKDKDGYESNDIVKVERPIKLETIWERQENEKVEMTIEEIEEKLGMEKGKLRVKGLKE